MLGMIIGTSSIITVLGISRAASGGISGTLNSFGDLGISINVDPNQDDPQASVIQYRDARTIEEDAGSLLAHIEPSYQRAMTLRANGVTTTTFAVSASEFGPSGLVMREGRRLERDEVLGAAHVCTISGPLSDRFFHGAPALGSVIRIGGTRCTVIGVYAELKGGFFNSIGGNEFIELPYTTFHGIAPGPIDGLKLYAAPGVTVERVSTAITLVLQRLHGSRSKYATQDNTAQVQSFNAVLGVIAAALTGIGGVALLVAGIGIMNIMLVSVTARRSARRAATSRCSSCSKRSCCRS